MSCRWGNEPKNDTISDDHRKEIFHFLRKFEYFFDTREYVHVLLENETFVLSLWNLLTLIFGSTLYLFIEFFVRLIFSLDVLEEEDTEAYA